MVSIFSAKENHYLSGIANDPAHEAALGSSLVLTISLVLAEVNIVLSLFLKKSNVSKS
ncbi:hypothetical protein [Bacillus sp. MUM 116]|uniref:hypothetical protein n=1 Tax=Bacillus sp. MUM 116 TaxID=1678002 RepID=UPI0015A71D7E|nr:hypothetical protein [Bacillus sp. MUM 116]